MSGGKDGQTLFHRILPAIAGGLTAVNWHFNVNDIEYNVGLNQKLLHHSQQAKNKLNL